MNCFRDVIKNSLTNIKSNILIVIIFILISVVYIFRSYYIGQITQSRKTKDILIFVGFVLLYYILNISSELLINKNLKTIGHNFINKLLEKIFNSKFDDLIGIKDNILNNYNTGIHEINTIYFDFFVYYMPNIISMITVIGVFIYNIPKVSIIIILSLIILSTFYFYCIKFISNIWNDYIYEYNKFSETFQNIMLNMWNVKYNSIDKRVIGIIKEGYKKKIDAFTRYCNFKVFIYNIPGLLFFGIFAFCLFIIIKKKNIKVSLIVFLIFQLYKVWRDFDILCSNTLHLYSNIKNINKICPAWLLEEQTNNNLKIDTINSIKFKNVKYSYHKNKELIVLDNINFNIDKGEIVYLNGHSGKGKSTIINLICRLFDVENGEIVINNNHNIKDINIDSLKKNICVVPQNINVFNDTIKNNIVLDNKYDKKKLNDIIKFLGLINNKNQYLDESHNAMSLSHGQKQRILIGRVIYNNNNKSVYIFDEYLSALDEKTAMKIHNYIIKFFKKNNKIGIFISHNKNEKIYFDKVINI